ncbi:GNAT family N-acetyltransferase [Rhodanobacter sp. Root627]|uniref:GNAT family N-acetyltransferase n=1 Tax=Rhodanobacter sp. Root627 TaxID=1736572 RepID=UPI000B1C0F12|nr:GNAT family N-acetyltransferase [Rhodanobacter sp. Root627]
MAARFRAPPAFGSRSSWRGEKKVLYVDDLTTLPGATSQGFAGALMDWMVAHARANDCQGVHLDTGYTRHAAHRLYLRKGLQLNCHHLALDLGQR